MQLKPRKICNELSEYIIAALFILECRSIYNNLDSTRNTFWLFSLTALGIAVTICILSSRKYYGRKKAYKVGLFLSFLLFYYVVYFWGMGYDSVGFLHYLFSVAIIAIYYFLCCDKKDVPKVLVKYNLLVCILAFISFFLWLFGSVLGIISPTNVIQMNWVGTGADASYRSYFNLLYEIQRISNVPILGVVFKNTGIFVEAPFYALHLSLALLIELFIKPKANKSHIFLLIATTITTFSTTGYLIGIVGITAYEFILGKRTWKKILLLVSPLVLIGVALISLNLISDKLSNMSGLTRLDDFRTGWIVFTKHPLFGVGYNNYKTVQAYMSAWRRNSLGISSSLMLSLSYGGLFLTLPYIFCLFRGIFANIQVRIFTIFFVFLWVVAAFPFQYITSFLLLFFSSQTTNGEGLFKY